MDLSRRDALKIGGFGLVGTGLVAFVGAPASPGNLLNGLLAAEAAPAPIRNEIVSVGGVLQGQLTLTQADAWVAGEDTSGTITYDGVYPGTVLRARPGDRVLLDVLNDTSFLINTHFHGMHVSPSGAADNVFAVVDPGRRSTTTSSSRPITPAACTGTTPTCTASSTTRSTAGSPG